MGRDLTKQPLDFDRMIRQGADIWRNYDKGIDTLEKIITDAADDLTLLTPMVTEVSRSVGNGRSSVRHELRHRFGIEVEPATWLPDEGRLSVPPWCIVDRERARPKTLVDVALLHDLNYRYMLFEVLSWAMGYAWREAYLEWLRGEVVASWWTMKYAVWGMDYGFEQDDRHSGRPARVALHAYCYVARNFPIVYAPLVSRGEGPSGQKRLQEAAAGVLSAWVRSRIKVFPSLREALAEERKPDEVLLRELPAEVSVALAELAMIRGKPDELAAFLGEPGKRRGIHKALVNRVTSCLRGGEGGERSDMDPDQLQQEQELAEFAKREQLERLIEGAGLSEQELEVFLRSATLRNKEIAERLDRSANQVGQEKHRAIRKLREAAGL